MFSILLLKNIKFRLKKKKKKNNNEFRKSFVFVFNVNANQQIFIHEDMRCTQAGNLF